MVSALLSRLLISAELVVSVLAQSNGTSILGTLNANTYLPHRLPGPPGTTRYYDWTITRDTIAPDGVEKPGLLVNNQFPVTVKGPLLEANQGDIFHITVRNEIQDPEEGTLLHWHGFLQTGTPWYDGVPGVDVCPISPGQSLVYKFVAETAGTTWWHSHYSAQLTDGLMGPVVIYGSSCANYDIDLGPILLSDNYHQDYHTYIDEVNSLQFEPVFADNNLINGKMYFDCSLATAGQSCTPSASISKFRFETGKMHLLRLINAGSDGIQCFSIDGHNMTVIATDFTEVEPYQVDVVTLGVGQRAHILVEGTGNSNGAYWMRSNISAVGTLVPVPPQPFALAAVYYERANTNANPTTVADPAVGANCGVAPLEDIHPVQSLTPPTTPAFTQVVNISLYNNASGFSLFHMNDVSFRVNYDHPVFLLAKLGNISYPDDPQWNVYNFGSNSSVRIIFLNTTPLVHPMHLHGHEYWVEAVGTGQWDGTVTNFPNPARRDVQLVPAGTNAEPGYIVLQWLANNPGVWPFHCHIAWHVSTGLYINVLEQPKKITGLNVPASMAQTCRDWWSFTNHNIVDQIDSGL